MFITLAVLWDWKADGISVAEIPETGQMESKKMFTPPIASDPRDWPKRLKA